MKRFVCLIISLVSFVASNAQKQLVIDPNAEMRAISGSFSKIKVSNGIDVFLSQSESESLAVSAEEKKYADRILTVVENGQLKISYNNEGNWNYSNKKLKVYISFKNIDELEASGSSDVVIAGTLKSENLRLKLSGSSDFTGNVIAGELTIDLSGSSDVKISGTATNLDLENSGASDLQGYDLSVDILKAKSSGASDVHVTVNKEISVEASGASDVYYRGNPVVRSLKSSGSSTVAQRESN